MKINGKRKEVVLDEHTLSILEEKAKQQGRNLKNYMEFVLQENANAFEPSEEYKIMMDRMIENHKKGTTNYTSWEIVKKDLLNNGF
jgi:ABC-type glutathione transport system ATPase component